MTIIVVLGSRTMTMMMTMMTMMTSKTMMRCSRPSVVLASKPDWTRQSHSTMSSVTFYHDNHFDRFDDDDDDDDVDE